MNSSSGTDETRERYDSLITEFGRGWEKGDAAKISALFAADGVFYPSPFDSPERGQAAIEAYWKDTPREQAEISFRSGEIFMVGPWFATEFKCTFRRRRTGEPVDVRGALFCETDGARFTEMRMYWHRTVTRPKR